MTTLPVNDNNRDTSEARCASMQHRLDRACRGHTNETGDDMWGFTVDAVIYLSQWLGLSQPELAREFFLALADQVIAPNSPELGIANARVIEAQIALLKGLRDRKAS